MGLFAKRLSTGYPTACKILAQSIQPFTRHEKGYICTSAGAHVQMHPTHHLCNMHRCFVSKRTLNVVTNTWPSQFLSWSLVANFDTLHAVTPRWPPKWAKYDCDRGGLNGPIPLRRPYGNRIHTLGSRRCKPLKSVAMGRVWPGRSYSDFFQ